MSASPEFMKASQAADRWADSLRLLVNHIRSGGKARTKAAELLLNMLDDSPTVIKVRKPEDSPMAINQDDAPQLGTPDWTFNNELTANRQPLTNADGSWNFPDWKQPTPEPPRSRRRKGSATGASLFAGPNPNADDAPQLPETVWNFRKDW